MTHTARASVTAIVSALSGARARRLYRRTTVTALLAVAAYVFTYRIGRQSMWLDEIYHRHIGLQPVNVLLNEGPLEWVQLSHLYYLTGQWCENLLGDPDLGVRLPQALAGVFTVLFAYLLGRHLFSTGAGIMAMIGLISSPLFVGYAQQNRFYHMAGLGFVASYYCFVMFCDSGRWRYWAGFIIAASFFLRVNSFGIIAVGMFGVLAVIVYLASLLSRGRAFYTLDLRRLGWIVLAGLIIGLLFLPYPVRLVTYFLQKGTSATAVDKFWREPFPLTINALVTFMRTRFVQMDASLLSPWWYLLPLGAAFAGSVVYGRSRVVLLCAYTLMATLPIIHTMNQAHAVVMEKRFLYLTPVLMIVMAGGLAMLVRFGLAGIRGVLSWCGRRLTALRATGAGPGLAVVHALLWVVVLRVFAVPVLSRAVYDTGQYFTRERAPYKLLAEVFKAYYRPTDALWWRPPQNDAWLMAAYMPTGTFLTQNELYYPYPQPGVSPTRADAERVLQNHTGLWMHQISPASYGYLPGQFVTLPLSRRQTFLVRPAYLTNAAACRADQEQMLEFALNAALLPEVNASEMLAGLLLARGGTNAADSVMEQLGAWHSSYDAMEAATQYFIQRGLTNLAFGYAASLADCYWYVPWLQGRTAQQAYNAHEYKLTRTCAKRVRRLAPDPDGYMAQLMGYSWLADSNYARAALWLGRAADTLKARARVKPELRDRYRRVYGDFVQASIKCGRASVAGGDYIAGWLRLADWQQADPFAASAALRAALADITRDTTNWSAFVHAVRRVHDEPELQLFVDLLRTEPYSPDERQALEALRDELRAQWWPLYVYALDMLTPLAWRAELVIPWSELPERGFEFATMPRELLEWLAAFYYRELGWGQAARFYGFMAEQCPEQAGWCALRRAELHQFDGDSDAALAVLDAYQADIAQERQVQARADRLRAAIGQTK